MADNTSIPIIVQGNSFSLAIPLQIYVIDDNEMVLEDYTPDPTDEVTIQLKGSRRNYTYTPTIEGNIANIDLGGYELADNYAVVVTIVKQDGKRLRSFRTDQFFIVESSDDLTQDDIIAGLEENVIYLNAQAFIAGADGRGIEGIQKTGTSGLVDTYTIYYTDNTTSTFQVTNGANGQAGAQGADGVGITSIEKTGTSGLVDTYTITLSNGSTSTFEVTNGRDGHDLGLAVIVDDLTTGGHEDALSAEQGKVLKGIVDNYSTLPITMKEGWSLMRNGTIDSYSTGYSLSNAIDVRGYKSVYITTALRTTGSQSQDRVVGVYDANGSFLRIAIDPRTYTSTNNTIVPINKVKVTLQEGDAFIRVSNYLAGDITAEVGFDEDLEFVGTNLADTGVKNTLISPFTTWNNQGTGSSTRKWNVLILGNKYKTAKLTLTLKDNVNYKAAIALSDYIGTYPSGTQVAYDSGWQAGFKQFTFDPTLAAAAHIRFNGFRDTVTDAEVNANIDEFYIEVGGTLIDLKGTLVTEDYAKKLVENKTKEQIAEFVTEPIIAHKVIGINHRGYNTVAPENTIPAFKLSVTNGFEFVETDVQFTSDDVAVLLHDASINRTARNADGTTISGTVNIADITYAEALTYDFGIWKGSAYAGTKIPTLAEFLAFCRATSIHPYIELKSTLTSAQAQAVAVIVSNYAMVGKVTYISQSIPLLYACNSIDKKSRLGFVTQTAMNAATISRLQSLADNGVEVFVDSSKNTAADIALCKAGGIPYEIWTIDSTSTIINADPYVTGVTSNSLNAAKVLHDAAMV